MAGGEFRVIGTAGLDGEYDGHDQESGHEEFP